MKTNQQILTKDWTPENEVLFIYNGMDNVVRHDLTGKEATYEVKKPRAGIVHLGSTSFLQRLRQIWRRHHVR
jgi:hypothetical protein